MMDDREEKFSILRLQKIDDVIYPHNTLNIITAKEATRTTTYTAVILVGIGVTGLMIYTVCKELLSSFSPQVMTVYVH